MNHTCIEKTLVIFSVFFFQVFALFLRPNKDHKYRFYWNIYHHSFGYTIIILGILNIFRGFEILSPDHKWKSSYITVIIALAVIALVLEAITWSVVMKKKCKNNNKTYDGHNNNGQTRDQHLGVWIFWLDLVLLFSGFQCSVRIFLACFPFFFFSFC